MTINPVLGEGELGVVIGDERVGDLIPKNWPESDRVKIGDGVHNWNDLPWFRGPIGPQGEKGADGKSAYDLWLEAGNEGSAELAVAWT